MFLRELHDALSGVINGRGFLHDLDPGHIQKLEGLALEACFRPDQIVFQEGETGGYFYLILSGSVVLENTAPSGLREIQFLHPGDAMGWSSLLDGAHKQFRARALTRVTAAAFDGAELIKVCEDDPRFGYAIMKRLLDVATQRIYASRHQLEKAAEH